MPWVRLDENFADHPKVERVGPLAAWLHVAALCYASRHLTDGRIPKAKAVRLTDIPDPAEHVSALLSEGMWVEDGTEYVIHDYLDYQPSKADVLKERSAARERMAKRRSPEVPANNSENFAESSGSPSRPVPTSDLVNRPQVTHEGDDPTGDDGNVPAAVWTHYADLKLPLEPPGSVRNATAWKRTCARNARTELADQAATWWHMFDLEPYRLAQALVDGQAPRHATRRNGATP